MTTVLANAALETLSRLNATYIDCVVTADADRFATILAPDFVCSNPDGTLVDRDEFLKRTRAAARLQRMDIDDVRIRVLGDVAIIHARTSFVLGDGRQGTGRYTDIWARRGGAWFAVAAHVTRS
ncbi:MAG TPA: nuclear transport factor 2 family protein [Vicinamibacterales bacterium]|nr:nuclear transport factor 2 family protein [Vicinamibacterales bacterium]